METADALLIESLSPKNTELANLMVEHDQFERQIEGLKSRRWLASTEQHELKQLKRRKLRGRDQIEAILMSHRRSA